MKPAICDERELVRGVINHDALSFDTLYWKYQVAVYQNILKLVKDQEVAKDILQEVFIALWVNRETLSPDLGIGGWLFTTSYRKCIDHLRITATLTLSEDETVLEALPESESNADQEIRMVKLHRAVSQLSPQKRKVFELCKINGKTYEEAAEELNISKYTVKEYLSAAMVLIKEYIHSESSQSLVSVVIIFSALSPLF